jgi:hypothetical protein
MILLALTAVVCLVIGAAIGALVAIRATDRLLAAMSTDELQHLGDRVVELRQSRSAS